MQKPSLYLAAVISSGKYSLVDNFHDNYDPSKQNNNELIFVYKSSVNDGAGESANGNWGDRLMGIHNMPGANACCGFHTATFNLLNAMKTDGATRIANGKFQCSRLCIRLPISLIPGQTGLLDVLDSVLRLGSAPGSMEPRCWLYRLLESEKEYFPQRTIQGIIYCQRLERLAECH